MELDLRLLLTLGGMGASILSAAVIVKTKLASTIDQLQAFQTDVEQRLRALDGRIDALDVAVNSSAKSISIFRDMFNPSERDKHSRELERHNMEIQHLRESVRDLRK
jgi:SMC interacting uncharacterized protein involved in chromosome segregation